MQISIYDIKQYLCQYGGIHIREIAFLFNIVNSVLLPIRLDENRSTFVLEPYSYVWNRSCA